MRESYRGEQEKHGCIANGDSSGSGVGLGGLWMFFSKLGSMT